MTIEDLAGIEYPRCQYDKLGNARRVETASEAVSLGMDWQYRPNGTPLFTEQPKPKGKQKE